MTFNKEALSDQFDSVSLAQEIRRQFKLGDGYAPLDEIAHAVGIWRIQEKELTSIEGALVVPEGKIEGEILLNSKSYPERKRFTLAHEIGHFVHPLHHPDVPDRFNCSKDDIFKSFGRGNLDRIEDEANDFAAELLLPNALVKNFVLLNEAQNFQTIIDLCDRLKISTAFALRSIQPQFNLKTAFIFSLKGRIRYIHSDNFPFLKVWRGDIIPSNAISNLPGNDNSVSDITDIRNTTWLKRDYYGQLCEQVYIQENGYRVTMLTFK